MLCDGHAKGGGHGAQQVVCVELCRHELRRDHLARIELLQQAADQRRLAGADFSGQRDEAFALVQPVLQIGVGALVAAAGVEERGIGAELERLA